MRKLNLLILTGCILIFFGCTPKKPITYNQENSNALNIVTAAGMSYGLKDVHAPKDTVSDIIDSKAFGTAYGLASYYSPTPGLSSSRSAGMAILSWSLLPKTPAARNSIIAWMPENFGGNSKDKAFNRMADLLIEATEKAANDLEYNTSVYIPKNRTDKRGLVINLVNPDIKKCSVTPPDTKSYCNIVYKVRHPHKIKNIANYVGSSTTWFFDPMESGYTAPIFINKYGFQFNQLEIMIAVSKHLPDWVYIYLAPNEVNITDKEKLKMPLILNKGNVHLFVKPEGS